MEEACYEISNGDLKPIRERLRTAPGVVSAEPSGATLHVFAGRTTDMASLAPGATVKAIEPSLEDVFIALIRKAERA